MIIKTFTIVTVYKWVIFHFVFITNINMSIVHVDHYCLKFIVMLVLFSNNPCRNRSLDWNRSTTYWYGPPSSTLGAAVLRAFIFSQTRGPSSVFTIVFEVSVSSSTTTLMVSPALIRVSPGRCSFVGKPQLLLIQQRNFGGLFS